MPIVFSVCALLLALFLVAMGVSFHNADSCNDWERRERWTLSSVIAGLVCVFLSGATVSAGFCWWLA